MPQREEDSAAQPLRLDRVRAARRPRSPACSPGSRTASAKAGTPITSRAVHRRVCVRGSLSSRGSCIRRSRSSTCACSPTGSSLRAAMVAWLFGVGLFGSTYLVPLFVQTVQGYTPYASGLLLMPGGLILGLFMPISRVPERPHARARARHRGAALFRRVVVLARFGRREQRVLDGRGLRRALAHRAWVSSSRRSTSPRFARSARSCSARAPA